MWSYMTLPNPTQPLTKFITICTYSYILSLYLNYFNIHFTAVAVPPTLHLISTMSPSVTDIQVENLVFPATVKPPGTCHTFFLAGAGVRGMEIQGKFIKFTAIGVYLEDSAIPSLATKWKGKTAEELTGCVPFFNDIVTGPFGKFTRVTTILPLTGKQYSEKVAENCVAHWKAIGSYTDEEAKAIDKFLEVFKDEDFPPGSSILFTQSSAGSLTIGFSKDSSIPEDGKAVIDNKQLAEAVLDSIIGEQGVSPAAKHSLAVRVSGVLKHLDHEVIGNGKALHFISTMSPSVTDIQVENHVFPATVKPPGTCRTFFLAGAGVRGMEIQGKFIKFTAIGVYLEESAIPSLALKWKGKTADELTGSVPFFNDIVTGPFDKFTHVTTILPLTGKQYSEKVAENCVAHWKAIGSYTDEEAKAIDKFLEVFKDENFPPGSSILFTQSSAGSLTIGFSKDSSIPEDGKAVIDNKQLAEAVLDSIIGEHGVSPAAKHSLAVRVSDVLKHLDHEVIGNGKAEVKKMVSNATEIETQVAGVDRNGNGTTE